MKTSCSQAMLVAFLGASGAGAQQLLPIRPIGPIVARAKESFGTLTVRTLADGRVLLDDATGRRLLLMDSSLTVQRVVLDTNTTAARSYGRPGPLIPYLGDSTLFLDVDAVSLVLIDPAGAIARVMSLPRPSDMQMLTTHAIGWPSVDAQGRLLYIVFPPPPTKDSAALAAYRASAGVPTPDSVAIVRANFTTRAIDTAGFGRMGALPPRTTGVAPDGRPTMTIPVLPFGTWPDDVWAVLRDGSIAIIRAQDYHIDWVRADGSREATPKIAHDWHRLTDEQKHWITDSVQRPLDSANANVLRTTPPGIVPAFRQGQSAADLPDYAPPYALGGPLVDLDGNIWIASRNYPQPEGGTIYDVVSSRGVLVDRVQLPGGCALVGLGRGVAYVTSREGKGTVLVRMRIR